MDKPTECKDCGGSVKKFPKSGDRLWCEAKDCGAFWCSDCGNWGTCRDLGSVFHHEHDGLPEPWGTEGKPV